LNVSVLVARDDRVPYLQPVGRENIAALAILVAKKRDAGRAIGIVFDRLNLRRYVFLVAFEINQPIETFMPATAVISGDSASIVSPATMRERLA
jgi:hypothetical protein